MNFFPMTNRPTLASAADQAYSPDGSRLAYVPMRRAFSAWKHYRGGDTTPIWLAFGINRDTSPQ